MVRSDLRALVLVLVGFWARLALAVAWGTAASTLTPGIGIIPLCMMGVDESTQRT